MKDFYTRCRTLSRRISYIATIAVLLAGLIICAPGVAVFPSATTSLTINSWIRLAIPVAEADSLDDIRYLIRNFYPENVSPTIFDVQEIEQVIKSLNDPYTEYMSTQDVQEFDDALNQNFSGVGIRIESHKDGAFIIGTLPNSPAREAGLVAGDIVVMVNKVSIKDWTINEIASIIRGTPGTHITLGVQRMASGIVEQITLTRANVTAPSVEWEMLPDKTGYINVSTFGDDTIKRFDAAVADLKKQGAKSLILDLRGNSGGYFDGALELAERFVDGTITYVQSRGGRPIAQRGKSYPNLQLKTVLLIDSGSASSSEILAAALKDNGFTLIGGRTFGKGVMQRVFNLSDGDYLKMTIAEFFSPTMKKIQSVGVTPTMQVLTPMAQEVRAFRHLNPRVVSKLHLTSGNIHARVNQLPGRSLRLTQEPIWEKSAFYLPARDVLEAIGAKVELSQDMNILVAAYQGRLFSINASQKTISINGGKSTAQANHVRQVDGICLISADLLKQIAPQLLLNQDKGDLVISW
jgi:carboxyl-terminal processing protease